MSTASPFTRKPPAAPTVAQLIRCGAREFDAAGLAYGHGTGDARDDAAALAFHALGLDHADAEAAYTLKPDQAQVAKVLALFGARVLRRTPAAYLMGRMWFAGLEFEVDPRVI
ncbi:MAG: 50S ribosomal protein L3 N(5)-glutamine methyltransferase, partial [Steroidobacteraceae bacterium]